MSHLNIFSYWLVLIGLLSGASRASCGLQYCQIGNESHEGPWRLGWSLHQTGFDIQGTSGSYSEGVASIHYRPSEAWRFNFHLPYTALSKNKGTVLGFSNPLAMAEYRWYMGQKQWLGLGVQGELPFGDDESGLAQSHFMLMPYSSWTKIGTRFFFSGTTGLSFAVGDGHHHEVNSMEMNQQGMSTPSHIEQSPLYVHPHEDFEWNYRLGSGVAFWKSHFTPGTFLSGQHVLNSKLEQGTSRDFISLGVNAPFIVNRYTLTPEMEIPVIASRRYEWTAGLGFAISF